MAPQLSRRDTARALSQSDANDSTIEDPLAPHDGRSPLEITIDKIGMGVCLSVTQKYAPLN